MTTPAPTQLMNGGRDAKPPERVRVALVAAAGSSAAGDLYRLLRRRLLTLSLIVAATFLVSLTLEFVASRQLDDAMAAVFAAPAENWLARNWRGLVMLAVSSVTAAVLYLRPPRSVRGLRAVEVVFVAVFVANSLSMSVDPLTYGTLAAVGAESARVKEAFAHRYALAGALNWFVVLIGYGTLIPNTWRRCLAMTGAIAVSPLALFAADSVWLRPLDPDIRFNVLATIGFYNALAVALAVFSSSRIETFRRQAAEARRLGQYTLRERLGSGGMGEVYRAEHSLLRRPCAIKVIRPEQAGDSAHLRRFEREVQATAELTHPNTVQIYDYGHADDGTFYYVMEYLPGETLESLVTREGPLSPERAAHFLRQICGALGEAHTRGLIHRDVKPGNVMVCERGGVPDVAKLLDFGLVLPVEDDPDGTKLTRAGTVTGTPGYLSPEQAAGRPDLDPRSDLYAVGALGYFLLTGRAPFAGRSPVETLAAHLYERPKPIREARPEVPAALETVILRCLAKVPGERFSDVAALEAALAAYRTDRPRPVHSP